MRKHFLFTPTAGWVRIGRLCFYYRFSRSLYFSERNGHCRYIHLLGRLVLGIR